MNQPVAPMTPLTGRRLLAVMPHPDDEAYSAAGTLALAAERGAACAVLCVTRGEAGGRPEQAAAEVAALRDAELGAACAAIGAERLPSLGWADGGLPALDAAPATRALVAAITAWRPDVVLGLGDDGVYGHRDHLALHGLLRAATAARAGQTTQGEPWALYEAVFPPRHFHPVWRGLRRRRFAGVVSGWTPQRFGHALLPDDVQVDVTSVAARKKAAICAHQSQLGGRDAEDFLRPGLMVALLKRECWRRVD